MRSVRVTVSGRVQGVGYRYSTWVAGARLGVAGWVRNLPDGRVEVFAQGENDRIDALISYLREGPRHAHVEALDIDEAEADPSVHGFEIAMWRGPANP